MATHHQVERELLDDLADIDLDAPDLYSVDIGAPGDIRALPNLVPHLCKDTSARPTP